MLTKTLLLLALILISGYFWQARKNAAKRTKLPLKSGNKASNTKSTYSKHRCVAIETGLIPCKAIRSYVGKRILMHEAPILPVQGCDTKKCECKFTRYDDRRTGPRRSKLKTANQIISESNNNKRAQKDRRNA